MAFAIKCNCIPRVVAYPPHGILTSKEIMTIAVTCQVCVQGLPRKFAQFWDESAGEEQLDEGNFGTIRIFFSFLFLHYHLGCAASRWT